MYTYTFRITPYRSWCFYEMTGKGNNVEEAKADVKKRFKEAYPEHPKFRVTQIKDWRIGCSMYD